MANQNITFDVASGTPYEANLTINGGANFSNIFTVKTLLKLAPPLIVKLDSYGVPDSRSNVIF